MADMLDVMMSRLPSDLNVVKVKELPSKYKVVFSYCNLETTGYLPKACAPGYQDRVSDQTIFNAMTAIALECGDLEEAKKWLDKTLNLGREVE